MASVKTSADVHVTGRTIRVVVKERPGQPGVHLSQIAVTQGLANMTAEQAEAVAAVLNEAADAIRKLDGGA